MSESVEKLTHVEHILKRPDSYVGPVSRVGEQYWIKDGDGFERKTLVYAPALLKIFDEILVKQRPSMPASNMQEGSSLSRWMPTSKTTRRISLRC